MENMSTKFAAGLLTGCTGTIAAADLKRIILFGGLCIGLSGCILMDQQAATTAKTALVGKSKSQILACAGIPNQTYRDCSIEYLAYAGSGNVRMSATANLRDHDLFRRGTPVSMRREHRYPERNGGRCDLPIDRRCDYSA